MIYIDQMGIEIKLAQTPKRIISLVPSQTELLFDLGLHNEVVGITKFCIHPDEWFQSKTKVGGTKTLDFKKIKELNPDLIIGNKEENNQKQIEELMKHYPVWMSDIHTLKQSFDMITRVGMMVDKNWEAINLKLQIEAAFNKLRSPSLPPQRGGDSTHKATLQDFEGSGSSSLGSLVRAAYFIWQKPFMVAGNNTFINEMLQRCGFENVFSSEDFNRYPVVSPEQIREADPQLIFLSSEPYPFQEKHIQEFQRICPDAKISLVDGEMFSWYGSRLVKAPGYFSKLLEKINE